MANLFQIFRLCSVFLILSIVAQVFDYPDDVRSWTIWTVAFLLCIAPKRFQL